MIRRLALLSLTLAATWAQAGIIVDGLGAITPGEEFNWAGVGAYGLIGNASQYYISRGPQFLLTKPTLITEIGAVIHFYTEINAVPAAPPLNSGLVEIRPATPAGTPDAGTVLATYSLSGGNDYLNYSYQSAKPDLLLSPGLYFAMFAAQGTDRGAIFSTQVSGPTAGVIAVGSIQPYAGSPVLEQLAFASRVVGTEVPEPSSLSLLAIAVAGVLWSCHRRLDALRPKHIGGNSCPWRRE